MPELAEVEFFRKQWDEGKGEPIREVLLHSRARPLRGIAASALVKQLTGARLVESSTHGKQLFFRFRPGATLGVHLGMTGRLTVAAADVPQGRHDHLVLRQKERSLVFNDSRMFGRIRFAVGAEPPAWETELPPEVLSPEFSPALFETALRRRARTPIKAELLDQEYFPGIGNWMADEILWQAGLAPQRLCGKIDAGERKRIYRTIRFVSRKALATIGKKFNDAPKGWLFAHRWEKGGNCPRCGTGLKHATVRGRTACWCPRCQPD